MREKTFRVPTVTSNLERMMGRPFGRVTEKMTSNWIESGFFVLVPPNYKDAMEVIENLGDHQFALFPPDFRVPLDDSNKGIKSLDYFLKIDSQNVLKEIDGRAPARLTKAFVQKYDLFPAKLIRITTEFFDVESAPMGYYWIGSDGYPRVVSWIRATTGAEMVMMKRAGDFVGGVIDKTRYGANIGVSVHSREDNNTYEFDLTRLPIHRMGDDDMFWGWVDVAHTSNDRDSRYRGREHDRRVHPAIFWSAPAIFGFYEAMKFVGVKPGSPRFTTNPFCIPTDAEMIGYIDKLRLRSFIVDDSGGNIALRVLNKSEIDRQIGAKTIERGYRNCWHHWSKKPKNYLYTPD